MASVDPLNSQSLYFAAAASAAQETARKEQAQKKAKTGQAVRTSFTSALKKSQEEESLLSEGLPAEIAGMDEESAVIFLKDAVDTAGDFLKENQGLEALEQYRKKVSQFLRYMTRNNFEVIEHKRRGFSRKGRPLDPQIQIKVINEKLNQLTSDMLYNHADNLKMLARVEEINGLIVDLLAA